MDIKVILICAVLFALLFTIINLLYYAGDRKYEISSIHNYPPDIQEEYFKTHERVDTSYRSKNVIFVKIFGLFIFIIILSICAYFAKARTFKDGFLVAFILMVWIGLYDTLFIDWVLFANMKMFRLEGTEHMDEAYHQKWFHLKGIIFPGLLFAVIVAGAVGMIISFVK